MSRLQYRSFMTGAIALLAVLGWAGWATADALRETARYPLSPIPLMQQQPVIDGVVDKREWHGASLLPQLTEYDAAIASPIRSKVYVGYSSTHLYFAFQFDRPAGAAPPRARYEGRNETHMFSDDCVGLWLQLPAGGSAFIGGNATNGFWDRRDKTIGTGDFTWNPDWSYRSRITETGWEGEMAIPFAELEATCPKPGDVWGFDLYNHQRTPYGALLTNVNRNNWWGADGLSQLLFIGKPVAVRFIESGPLSHERAGGAVVEVVNGSSETVNLQTSMKLYRRKSGPAGGANNFLASIVSGTNQSGMDAVKDMKLDGLIEDALTVYDLHSELDQAASTMEVAPGRTGKLRLTVDEPAEYLLMHQIRMDGQLVSGRALPFLLPPPIHVVLDPYLLTASKLVAKVKLSDVQGWGTGSTLRISLLENQSQKVLDTVVSAYQDLPTAEAALSLAQAGPGQYTVRVEVIDARGAVRATRDEHYHRPEAPVWNANNLGRSVAVPKPWSPISLQGDAKGMDPLALSVWGRTYTQGDQPGFKQITTQDAVLLASPLTLVGKVNGKDIVWKRLSRQVTEQDSAAVTTQSVYTAGGLTLTWTVATEFDGFAKINIKLDGAADVVIDELALVAPLNKASATLYSMDMWLRRDGDPGKDRTGDMPQVGQVIEHRITQTSWVGNADHGLMFNFQNDRDWHYARRNQAITVTPREQDVLYTLRLIDNATPMDRPRDIEFSMMATPVKPRPVNYSEYEFFQITGFGDAPRLQEMKDWVDQCAEAGIKYVIVHSDWNEFGKYDIFGWPQIPNQEVQDHVKNVVDYIHSKCMKSIFYVGWYISMNSQDWDPWGTEMMKSPAESGGYKTMMTVFNRVYNDAMIYRIAEVVDRIGFDGIFWDSTLRCAASDSLYRPGEGWLDDQGQQQPTFPIWATRDLMKRLWVLFKHEKRTDGVIYAGNPGVPFMPVQSFNDIHHPGEGPEQHVPPGTMHKNYSPAYGMARNMGTQYGIITEKTVKGPLGFNALMAINLPHDMTGKAHTGSLGWPKPPHRMLRWQDYAYGRHQHTAVQIYHAREWVNVGTSQWLPYWRNEKYLTTSPAQMTLASMHLQPGDKALVVVSNLAGEGRDITITFHPEAMGFPAGQKLHVYDAFIEHKQYEVVDNRVTIPIENERFRMLMITGKLLDRALPPQTTGEDLVADRGGMESVGEAGRVAGWAYVEQNEASPVFAQDTEHARTGKASLRIDRPVSNKTYIPVRATLGQVAVKPNTRYLMRAYVRGEQEMQVQMYGAFQGATIGDDGLGYGLFVGDYTGNQWAETRIIFDSGERTSVPVSIYCFGGGTLWVDDVQLFELAPEDHANRKASLQEAGR